MATSDPAGRVTAPGLEAHAPPSVLPSRGEFDPWLAMLFDWEHDPDPAKRVECAQSLMRCLAAAISSGREIPQPLRAWLGQRLRRAAATRNANAAFRLKPGSGQWADYRLHMHDAAQLHALAQWHTKGPSKAANDVEDLPGRKTASVLAKRHSSISRDWSITGPYVADANGQPTRELANQKDLAQGAPVVVVFTSNTVDSHQFVLVLPQDLANVVAWPASLRRPVRK